MVEKAIIDCFESREILLALDLYAVYLTGARSTDWQCISLDNVFKTLVVNKTGALLDLVVNTQWHCLALKYKYLPMNDSRKKALRKRLRKITAKTYTYKHSLLTSIFGLALNIASETVNINPNTAERSYITSAPQIVAAKEVLRFDSLNKYLDAAAIRIVRNKLKEVNAQYPQFFLSL